MLILQNSHWITLLFIYIIPFIIDMALSSTKFIIMYRRQCIRVEPWIVRTSPRSICLLVSYRYKVYYIHQKSTFIQDSFYRRPQLSIYLTNVQSTRLWNNNLIIILTQKCQKTIDSHYSSTQNGRRQKNIFLSTRSLEQCNIFTSIMNG